MLSLILHFSSKAVSTEWTNYSMQHFLKKDNLLDQEMLPHHKDPGILVCGDRSSSVHLVNIHGLYCQFQKTWESSSKEGGPKSFFIVELKWKVKIFRESIFPVMFWKMIKRDHLTVSLNSF